MARPAGQGCLVMPGIAPSLLVTPRAEISRIRRVPPGATVLVSAGASVAPADIVARAKIPGPVHSIAAAARLGVSAHRMTAFMTVAEGDAVTAGQVIARRTSFAGLWSATVVSPADGTVMSVSPVSGHVLIAGTPSDRSIRAFCGGVVESVNDGRLTVRNTCAVVQGVFGFGGEVYGPLVREAAPGAIVLAKSAVTAAELREWRKCRVAGVIAPSMAAQELFAFAGGQLNPAATADVDAGLTLMLTGGFGSVAMASRTLRILDALVGSDVAVSGATQVRAGVLRPELVGPPVALEDERGVSPDVCPGAFVRVVRGVYGGRTGKVVEIPAAPRTLASGVSALVYIVAFDDGTNAPVPRPNVEL